MLPSAVVSYIYGHYVTGLQFDRNFDRIYISSNMLSVLSWRRQLRTYEAANLEVYQPIRNRSAERSGFGLLALAEILVSHGIL